MNHTPLLSQITQISYRCFYLQCTLQQHVLRRFIVVKNIGKKYFHRDLTNIFYRLRYASKRWLDVIKIRVIVEGNQRNIFRYIYIFFFESALKTSFSQIAEKSDFAGQF